MNDKNKSESINFNLESLPKRNKYNAQKITVDGVTYDSKFEAKVGAILLEYFPREQIEVHQRAVIKPACNYFKARTMSIDFLILDKKDEPLLWVEAKGYSRRDFKLNLETLAYFNPYVFQRLLIVFESKGSANHPFYKPIKHKVILYSELRKYLLCLTKKQN